MRHPSHPSLPVSAAQSKDTEQVKGSSHVDDGVSRLWLLPRCKLDDLLGRLQELRHSSPGAVTLGALKKGAQVWFRLQPRAGWSEWGTRPWRSLSQQRVSLLTCPPGTKQAGAPKVAHSPPRPLCCMDGGAPPRAVEADAGERVVRVRPRTDRRLGWAGATPLSRQAHGAGSGQSAGDRAGKAHQPHRVAGPGHRSSLCKPKPTAPRPGPVRNRSQTPQPLAPDCSPQRTGQQEAPRQTMQDPNALASLQGAWSQSAPQ